MKLQHLFKGKLSSELNWIFMKSFSYSPFLPSFIASIRCLILSESFVNFANTVLLPYVELKTKYLFPLFSSICPSASPMIRHNALTLLILS